MNTRLENKIRKLKTLQVPYIVVKFKKSLLRLGTPALFT